MKKHSTIRYHMPHYRKALMFLLTPALFLLSSCTLLQGARPTTTYFFEEAPYYYGGKEAGRESPGFFPITLDVRLAESKWDSTRTRNLLPLLEQMNDFLDSLQSITRLASTGLSIEEAPDVFIGLTGSDYDPASYKEMQRVSLAETPRMVMHLRSPSGKWRKKTARLSVERGVGHFLYITLGLSDYEPVQSGWSGQLELRLGTGYHIPLPWLNEPEPIEVLHLTGVLLDREGHILKAGAEGIIAKKTGYLMPVLGLREGIPDYDLRKVSGETRRDDLPGKPLAWKVALQNLVAVLTGQENLLIVN